MTINSWATSSKWENYEVRSRNGDDLWNLQFTRWWGWNWVKKREELLKEQLLRSENVVVKAPIVDAYCVEPIFSDKRAGRRFSAKRADSLRNVGGAKPFMYSSCGKSDCDYCLKPYKWFYRRFLKFKRKKSKLDPNRKKELVGRFLTPCASDASCPCRYFKAFQENPCTVTQIQRTGRDQKAWLVDSSSSSSCAMCCCCRDQRERPICSDCASSCSGCLCDPSSTQTKKEYVSQLVQTFTVDYKDQNSQTFAIADDKYTQTECVATADQNIAVVPTVREQSCDCCETKQKRLVRREKKHRHCCQCRKRIATKHCCECKTSTNRQHHCCHCQQTKSYVQQNQNCRCVCGEATLKYVQTKEKQVDISNEFVGADIPTMDVSRGAGRPAPISNQNTSNFQRNCIQGIQTKDTFPVELDDRFVPRELLDEYFTRNLQNNQILPQNTKTVAEEYLSRFRPTYKHSPIKLQLKTRQLEENFKSPLSGRNYNVAPPQLERNRLVFERKLPEPMNLNEDLKFLQKYALNVSKMADAEHKGILDAVLDTILNGRRTQTKEGSKTYMDCEGARGFGDGTKQIDEDATEQLMYNLKTEARQGIHENCSKIHNFEKFTESVTCNRSSQRSFDEIHENITNQTRLVRKHEDETKIATENDDTEVLLSLPLRSPRNSSFQSEKLVITPTGLSTFVSTTQCPHLAEVKQRKLNENKKNVVSNTQPSFTYCELTGVDPKMVKKDENLIREKKRDESAHQSMKNEKFLLETPFSSKATVFLQKTTPTSAEALSSLYETTPTSGETSPCLREATPHRCKFRSNLPLIKVALYRDTPTAKLTSTPPKTSDNVNFESLGAKPKLKSSQSPSGSFRTCPTWSDVEVNEPSSIGSVWNNWSNNSDQYLSMTSEPDLFGLPKEANKNQEESFILDNLKTFSASISDTSKLGPMIRCEKTMEDSSVYMRNRAKKRTSKTSFLKNDSLEKMKRRRKM